MCRSMGSAHTAVVFAWLFGLLVRRAWQAVAAEPLLSIVAAGVGVLLLLDNKDEVIRRVRAARVAIRDSGARLLDAATPLFQEWEEAKVSLASPLEQPMLSRSVESISARQMATRRLPVSTEALLAACEGAGSPASMSGLTRFLRGHSSFTVSSSRMWELGRLGSPTIDGRIGAEEEPHVDGHDG